MTDPAERIPEEPATPEQAASLLTEVGTVTTVRGKNYGDRNTYGEPVTELPAEVAAHLPEPTDPSSKITNSVYITQMFDRTTGQPLRKGVVGMVSFTRHEKPDDKLTYAAHANYHITTEDGETYGVERHVTNTEHGPHKVVEMRQKLGRASIDPAGSAQDMLAELTSLRDRLDATRPVEQAMGMFTVTQAEADSVIGFMRTLNGEQ